MSVFFFSTDSHSDRGTIRARGLLSTVGLDRFGMLSSREIHAPICQILQYKESYLLKPLVDGLSLNGEELFRPHPVRLSRIGAMQLGCWSFAVLCCPPEIELECLRAQDFRGSRTPERSTRLSISMLEGMVEVPVTASELTSVGSDDSTDAKLPAGLGAPFHFYLQVDRTRSDYVNDVPGNGDISLEDQPLSGPCALSLPTRIQIEPGGLICSISLAAQDRDTAGMEM